MKLLTKDQRGIALPAIIGLLVVIAGVAGAGYYVFNQQKDSDSSTNNSQTTTSKEIEAECKLNIDDKDLCKMAGSFDYETGNYVMTMTGEQEGQQVTWTVQTDGQNSQANILGFETISYNGDSYVKDASGAWVKYPASSDTENDTDDITQSLDFSEEEASWYTKVGKEACGDMTCFHYSYKNPNDSSENAEFYFDDKQYRIRKVTSSSPEDGTMVITITYGNAKVSPPATFTTQGE